MGQPSLKLITDKNLKKILEYILKQLKHLLILSESSGNPFYKSYSALLTQTGVDAPTALVKQPLTGVTVTYSYVSPAVYKIIFSEPILTETNHRVIQGAGNQSSLVSIWAYYDSPTELTIECYDLGNTNITIPTSDDILLNQYIEIQIDND